MRFQMWNLEDDGRVPFLGPSHASDSQMSCRASPAPCYQLTGDWKLEIGIPEGECSKSGTPLVAPDSRDEPRGLAA